VLRVSGDPGGIIHLAAGQVTAVTSPGAPDPEVVLLRSGRVNEDGWSAAFAVAASDGRMSEELVARGLIRAGELEALLRTAYADALFAIVAGQIEDCRLEQAALDALLPLAPGVAAEWLLAEADRRVAALASLPVPVIWDRDRVVRAPVQGQVAEPGAGAAEILALANGRRTARDMAFVLGRGVYAVTQQVARMRADGLLDIGSSRRTAGRRPGPGSAAAGDDDADADQAGRAGGLPRRRRATSGLTATLRPGSGQTERGSVLRLLRPGTGRRPTP
jgi:hypothetical protein